MERALLRIEEAAEVLGLGRSSTYRLVRSGDLPSVRVGRSVRVPAAGLRDWVERHVKGAERLANGQQGIGSLERPVEGGATAAPDGEAGGEG